MKNTSKIAGLLGAPLLLLASGAVMAHAGTLQDHAFVSGLAHPFTGWDHALAAVVAGMVAARGWAQGRWLPLLFVAGMAGGMLLSLLQAGGNAFETGIGLSLLAAGVLLLVRDAASRLAPVVVFVLVMAGVAHGQVHGAEAGGAPVYLGAVLLSTALLHAAGWLAGHGLSRAPVLYRGVGVGTALLGVFALA